MLKLSYELPSAADNRRCWWLGLKERYGERIPGALLGLAWLYICFARPAIKIIKEVLK